MSKASRSGRVLSNSDAAIIKGMIARGDRQHDIAACFGVNGGRVGEISKGHTFQSAPIVTAGLPPSAPFVILSATMLKKASALRAILVSAGAPSSALQELDDIISSMKISQRMRGGV